MEASRTCAARPLLPRRRCRPLMRCLRAGSALCHLCSPAQRTRACGATPSALTLTAESSHNLCRLVLASVPHAQLSPYAEVCCCQHAQKSGPAAGSRHSPRSLFEKMTALCTTGSTAQPVQVSDVPHHICLYRCPGGVLSNANSRAAVLHRATACPTRKSVRHRPMRWTRAPILALRFNCLDQVFKSMKYVNEGTQG